eukprot:EG_transcript_5551
MTEDLTPRLLDHDVAAHRRTATSSSVTAECITPDPPAVVGPAVVEGAVACTVVEAQPENEKHADLKHKKLMFFYLIIMQILLNYDSGAIPPSLVGRPCVDCGDRYHGDGIKAQFHLSIFMEGALGSLVYLGLTVASFFAGGMLQTYSPKRVLGGALLFNCLSCFLFSASHSLYFFFFSRFAIGLSQAFLVIYPPVWVDEFAPKAHVTTWMSLTQSGVPIGIMAGYAAAGFLLANTDWGWRPAFYGQAIALTLLSAVWFFIPSRYIDPDHGRPMPLSPDLPGTGSAANSIADMGRQSRKGMAQVRMVCRQTRKLLFSALWLSTCMALCALYFVVTGIQLWITPYLQAPPIAANMNLIVMGFTATSATAPILGVLFGGWVVDRVGGYQEHMNRAALVATVFGGLATLCAMLSLFLHEFWAIITLVWFLLFFGGGVVPAATGILLAAVPRDQRSLASAISMLLYNLLGFFLGPFLSGLIAEFAGDLKWSFRVIMLWSNLSLVFMLLSWRFAERRVKKVAQRQASTVSNPEPAATPPMEMDTVVTLSNGHPPKDPDGVLGSLTPGYA